MNRLSWANSGAPDTHQRTQRISKVLAPAFVLLLGWLLIGPLWDAPGLPNSADGILHLHRAAEMTRAWASGVFWPRWFPDAYQGLGVPVFHYYSPLFYVLVAPLHLLSLPLDLAAKIIISGAFVISGLAVYAWLRRLFSPAAGLAGAALYLSGPHFFREYYFQGDYPQTIALFWLPVTLWAFTRLYQDGRWRNWLLAILSLAVLVTAHNITAMLGGVLLALYWLALPLWQRSWQGWRRGPVAAVLGGGLSAFFWMPALGDIPLVRVNTLRETFFHYSQWFVHPSDLLAAPPLLDRRAINPPFPEMLGWAAWLALAAGCVIIVLALLRTALHAGGAMAHEDGAKHPERSGGVFPATQSKDAERPLAWPHPSTASGIPRRTPLRMLRFFRAGQAWAAVGLAISALYMALTQAWSAPVWEHLPGISLLQFPGRLLGPAAVGVSLVWGAAVHVAGRRWARVCLLGTVLAIALSSSVFLFPRHAFVKISDFTVADTHAFERDTGAWGTTSSNGYLPRWADLPGAYAGQQAQARVTPAGAQWTWETPYRAVLTAAAGTSLPAGQITLPVHYFPAWRIIAGPATLPTQPVEAGLIGVVLPQPAAQLTLVWAGTNWERRGEWVSRLTLLLLVIGSGWVAFRRFHPNRASILSGTERRARSEVEGCDPREAPLAAIGRILRLRSEPHAAPLRMLADAGEDAVGVALALGLLLLLIGSRYVIAKADLGWFQLESPANTVANAAHPLEIALGSDAQPGVKLLGWEMLPDSATRPGGELRVRLFWQAQSPMTETLHSFAHLVTPALQRSWAVVQNEHPGRIPTDQWTSSFYVVDDLVLRLPLDLPPVTYTLAAGLVDDRGQRLAVRENADGLVFLDTVSIAPLQAGRGQPLRPANAAPASFGQALRLQGYDLLDAPGGRVLRLYWQVLPSPRDGAARADLVTFVQLLDEQNAIVAQFDGPPLAGLWPTSHWTPGALVVDSRQLRLPADLPPGAYRILVGLYDPNTMTRAPVKPEAGAEGHFSGDNALVIPLRRE